MTIIFIILSIIALCLWIFQIVCSFSFYIKEHVEIDYRGDIPGISVIVPSFNENQPDLDATINSLLAQQLVHFEIIVVDDGSQIPLSVKEHSLVKLIRLHHNCGKRQAQMAGVEHAKYDWIATIDSDTILDPYALYYLYCGIKRQKADAITGTIFVANRRDNLLTKLVSCMYGLSIFQQRAEQSLYSTVTCCSGALSLYNKSIMLQNKHDYLTQTFLGRQCKAGDDRHMTSMFLLSGHKVGWTSKARCWTKTPSSMSKFLKQQMRWVRSNCIEMTYLFPQINKWSKPFMFFTFKLMFTYFYRILLFIMIIISSIVWQSALPFFAVISLILLSSVIKCAVEYFWNYSVTRQTSGLIYLVLYVLFEFLILTPVITFAILTPYQVGWLTRKKVV